MMRHIDQPIPELQYKNNHRTTVERPGLKNPPSSSKHRTLCPQWERAVPGSLEHLPPPTFFATFFATVSHFNMNSMHILMHLLADPSPGRRHNQLDVVVCTPHDPPPTHHLLLPPALQTSLLWSPDLADPGCGGFAACCAAVCGLLCGTAAGLEGIAVLNHGFKETMLGCLTNTYVGFIVRSPCAASRFVRVQDRVRGGVVGRVGGRVGDQVGGQVSGQIGGRVGRGVCCHRETDLTIHAHV